MAFENTTRRLPQEPVVSVRNRRYKGAIFVVELVAVVGAAIWSLVAVVQNPQSAMPPLVTFGISVLVLGVTLLSWLHLAFPGSVAWLAGATATGLVLHERAQRHEQNEQARIDIAVARAVEQHNKQ